MPYTSGDKVQKALPLLKESEESFAVGVSTLPLTALIPFTAVSYKMNHVSAHIEYFRM